eukprot:TRINITY_DN601_c0_g1_i1.p1 TRINITY_DN601_c0_g1~~TRINITY_DN601_c0_g1_i1.p1  ORF type:complete len:181 (-),score=4.76 TRINITY_DN601_c0_g1_i1:293-835(-)
MLEILFMLEILKSQQKNGDKVQGRSWLGKASTSFMEWEEEVERYVIMKRRKPKNLIVVVLIGMLLHQLWRSQRLDLDTCAGDDCVIIGASEDLSSAASSERWRQTFLEDHACKHPDILKSYKGITVETGSTDVGEDSSCGHYKLDSKQFQVHSHSAPSLVVYVIAICKTSYLAYQNLSGS